MKTISHLYPILNMVPAAAMVVLVGMAVVRQGFDNMEATAPMFAVCVLTIIGAAATTVLNPRH